MRKFLLRNSVLPVAPDDIRLTMHLSSSQQDAIRLSQSGGDLLVPLNNSSGAAGGKAPTDSERKVGNKQLLRKGSRILMQPAELGQGR
jgi:hypothetical protein